MGKIKFLVVFVAMILLSSGFVGMGEDAFAKKQKNTTKIIHLGYLQLAAHDFFDMNRTTETDNENGKLDLSTVLFNPKAGDCNFEKSLDEVDGCVLYDDFPPVSGDPVPAISNGGEKRSVENIMISTAGAEVGEKYLKFKEKKGGEEKAYKKVLKFYHKQIEKAFKESFHLKFPKPQDGEVTNLHNLALRGGHDFLPAEIVFDGNLVSLFAIDPLGDKLDKKEKKQRSSPVDGEFDVEFTGIDFCPVPPFFCISVDLLLADQTFGDQFGLGADTFDEFMDEQADGKFDKKDEVSKLLKELFAKGLNLT